MDKHNQLVLILEKITEHQYAVNTDIKTVSRVVRIYLYQEKRFKITFYGFTEKVGRKYSIDFLSREHGWVIFANDSEMDIDPIMDKDIRFTKDDTNIIDQIFQPALKYIYTVW